VFDVNGATCVITETNIPDDTQPEDYHGNLSIRLAIEAIMKKAGAIL